MKKVVTASGVVFVNTKGISLAAVVDNSKKESDKSKRKYWVSIQYVDGKENVLVGFFNTPEECEGVITNLI